MAGRTSRLSSKCLRSLLQGRKTSSSIGKQDAQTSVQHQVTSRNTFVIGWYNLKHCCAVIMLFKSQNCRHRDDAGHLRPAEALHFICMDGLLLLYPVSMSRHCLCFMYCLL